MSNSIILFMSYFCSFYYFFIFLFIFYPSQNGEITLLFTDNYVNLALVANFDVANMSFNAIRVYFRINSSLCCYSCYRYFIHVYVHYTC